jgi:hypothetical protein
LAHVRNSIMSQRRIEKCHLQRPPLNMSPQSPQRPHELRRSSLLIHTQRKSTSTRLARISLARHSALAVIELSFLTQAVSTETLSTELSARHAVSPSLAVSYTFRVRDCVLPDIRKRDAGKHACVGVLVAALERPAICNS